MPQLNHKTDASSSIDWADPAAAIQIATAATKQESSMTILVNEKYQVKAWSSVLKGTQDVVDLTKVASILDRAVASSAAQSQQARQTDATEPTTVMVIVALTGLFAYLIRKNYAINATATGNSWSFTLNLTPSSSS